MMDTNASSSFMMPRNLEAETALLSLAFLSSDMADVFEMLEPSDFYETTHQQIWQAILANYQAGHGIDVVVIQDELKKQNLDAKSAMQVVLSIFESPTVYGGNAKKFAHEIKNAAILRRLLTVLEGANQQAQVSGSQPRELITELEKNLIELSEEVIDKRPQDLDGILDEVEADIENTRKHGWKAVQTQIPALDEVTGGFIPTHVWIVGAYCMGKGTKVSMWEGGQKSIEDVKVGDYLSPVDSPTPRKVLEVVEGVDEMYRVSGKYIDPFSVNKEHILPMVWVGDGYAKNIVGKVYLLPVKEFLTKSKREQRGFRLLKSPTAYKGSSLPISPWLFGFWLGDGRSRETSFAVGKEEEEIIKALRDHAEYLGLRYVVSEPKKDGVLSIGLKRHLGDHRANKNNLYEALKSLNVINNKHIPEVFLNSSIEDRLELLAGLIDSDGSVSGAGKSVVTFCQVNKTLIDQVKILADSLGFNTRLVKLKQSTKNTLFKGNGVGYIWKLFITGNVSKIPNRVKRKGAKVGNFLRNHLDKILLTFSINPLGKGQYYGFRLDGNHLYLAQNGIVNHNTGTGKTFFLVQMILNILKQGKTVMMISTEMDRKMIMLRLLGNLCGIKPLKIMRGLLDDYELEQLEKAKEQLRSYKNQLFIVDNVYTTHEIRLKAKKVKLETGSLDVLMVDFIQNLQGQESIYERMSQAAIDLQEMAQSLNTTVVIASQVSQQGASRVGKDEVIEYKGAGEIAAIADVGLWITKYKPKEAEKYGCEDYKTESGGSVTFRKLLLRKVRHGEPRSIDLRMDFPAGTVVQARGETPSTATEDNVLETLTDEEVVDDFEP